ncbi:MAG: type VI secretion system tube protein Hcp [Dehalococcoidia bacterium]|nr:type VI secretion system tube protein Hcp [Dehalococcoidia bacterium]
MKKLLILCLAIVLIAGLGISISAMAAKPHAAWSSATSTIPAETSASSGALSADMESSGQSWYIKFDGVDGGLKGGLYDNWSEMLSFNQLITQTGGPSTNVTQRTPGSANAEDIMVSKSLDKASTKLAEAALKGQIFPKTEIHFIRHQGERQLVYYTYELKNVRITRYQVGGTNNADFLTEELSLHFEEMKVTYTEFDFSGNAMGRYEYVWKAGQARA